MNDQIAIDDIATREVMARLFEGRPVSTADLRNRLSQIDRTAVRRMAVNRLEERSLSEREGPVILAVLELVGVGQESNRLAKIALDIRREPQVRLWAAIALTGEEPMMMDLLVTELGPEGLAHPAENALVELITLQSLDRIGRTVRRALEEWHQALSPPRLLERIETCRRGLGVSCAQAYGECLTRERLSPLTRRMFDLFIEEAADDGIDLFESLRARARTEGERRELQGALLRMRSARIDYTARRREPKGYAMVSNCDGQGGFVVLGIFENEDHTATAVELYIHVGGRVQEMEVHARIRPAEVALLLEQLEQEARCAFARTELGDGASLVMSALGRTEATAGVDPGELSRSENLFRRVSPRFSWGDGPCATPAANVTPERIHTLLKRPEYRYTWVFDQSELESVSFPLRADARAVSRWRLENAPLLNHSMLRERIIAMAEHMSRWHCWKGEAERAALCRALMGDAERDFARSVLFRAMLQRSMKWMQEGED